MEEEKVSAWLTGARFKQCFDSRSLPFYRGFEISGICLALFAVFSRFLNKWEYLGYSCCPEIAIIKLVDKEC